MKINSDEISWQETQQNNFSYSRKQLSANGKMLGSSLYRLLPGKKAFPYHFHTANEEAIYVLQGSGTLRLNNENIAIQVHDYIALPRGAEHAHQIINTSDAELIYLCISTMIEPEVMGYPDSNKIGVMIGSAPGGKKQGQSFKAFYCKSEDVDYYFDEE